VKNSTNPDLNWIELDLRVACRSTNLSRDTFLRAAGISSSEFDCDSDKVLSRKIWETAEKLTGQPDIGLYTLDELRLDDFGDLGLAVITAEDFRSAIHNLVALSGTVSRQWKYYFLDHLKFPSVSFEETEENPSYSHHEADASIAIGVFLARALLGKSNYDVYRVNFRHPDFGLSKQYEERLGCRCRFDMPIDSVEFAADSLCHPMPLRNKPLHDALLTQLQNQLASRDNLAARVSQTVYELIRRQLWPSRQRVSAEMGLGERTMLRQLKIAETTFRSLQERVLEREARRLLELGLPAEQVAEKLGYSGSSPVARMIKRRTGKMLSELREGHSSEE
jgi:AraC-like DNA-binding protein